MIAGMLIGFLLGLLLMFTALTETTRQIVFQGAGVLVGIPIGIWVLSLLFEGSFKDFKVVLVTNEPDEGGKGESERTILPDSQPDTSGFRAGENT